MAGVGKPSLVLVSLLIIFLYSSKMTCISSAEPPSNISKTKEKGNGAPQWHVTRGIKISVDGSQPKHDGRGH
ncbi:hypothetical protein ACOSQ3_012803 [Xanthoceras sorbifolium]